MINRTVLVGRLTKDPDLRYTPNGVAACTFTLAVNRTFTNANGDREVDFIQVVTWRKQAENTANFLKKGSLAGVEGRLQSRSYEKDGKRVYVTEVVADSVQFLEPKNAREQQGGQSDYQGNQSNQNRQQQGNEEPAYAGGGYGGGNSSGGYGGFESSSSAQITDDDLPF